MARKTTDSPVSMPASALLLAEIARDKDYNRQDRQLRLMDWLGLSMTTGRATGSLV